MYGSDRVLDPKGKLERNIKKGSSSWGIQCNLGFDFLTQEPLPGERKKNSSRDLKFPKNSYTKLEELTNLAQIRA
jgi:hypothetical protein